MSEQLYYTYSTIGSGTTTGERIRAQSRGLVAGSANNERLRALRPYLSYKLPNGSYLRTASDQAPISLVLSETAYGRILLHKKCVERDGIGRSGNFFTHAIVTLPDEVITLAGQLKKEFPLSARTVIRLWRSDFWQTSEEELSPKETLLPDVEPGAFSQAGPLSAASVLQSHQYCYNGMQTAADWLPQVLSAFLMLEKLDKTQICIAAPAEMVAIFIWCITHCLPRTLTALQKFTFSTYECEINRTPFTLVGTCWLPSGIETASFVPQQDLPSVYYQEHPANKVQALNCYLNKATPFEVEPLVQRFAQFATRAFMQNNVSELLMLAGDAERQNCQTIDNFLMLFRLEQETPTREMVQQIFSTGTQWSLFGRSKVQEKFLALFRQEDRQWNAWWSMEGRSILHSFRTLATQSPESLEAQALRMFACRVVGELCQDLGTEQQQSAEFWDDLLGMMSNSGNMHDLPVWITLLQRLSQLSYTKAYESWWNQTGQKVLQQLYQLARSQRNHPFGTAFNQFVDECMARLLQAWRYMKDVETSFWLSLLPVVLPPAKEAARWYGSLDQLNRAITSPKIPSSWCGWENYLAVLLIWKQVANEQCPLPGSWLLVSWARLPKMVLNQDVPTEWRVSALIESILRFKESSSAQAQILNYARQCASLMYEALTRMMGANDNRDQAVAFCEFLLQQNYPEREPLLAAILPLLFPYPELTQRIATAASLSEKELVEFAEKTLHEKLTTQQEIPEWLLPLLQNYLVYFNIQAVMPEFTKMSAQGRAWEVLEVLVKQKQTLPTSLHVYIECWHTVAKFFRQTLFHRSVLKQVGKSMDDAPLNDSTRSELNQTMISFLAEKISTEVDLGRVIDIFGKYLVPVKESEVWASLQLLKELSYLVGRQSNELPRVIIYIKVLLGEMSTLEMLGRSAEQQVSFIDGCLGEVLINIPQVLLMDLETGLWPVMLNNKWKSYLYRRHNPRRSAAVSPSSTQDNAVSNVISTDAHRARSGPMLLPGNMPAAAWNGRSSVQRPSPTRQEQSPAKPNRPLEDRLYAFRKAYKNKDIANMYDAYNVELAHVLTAQEKQLADMIVQLFRGHDIGKNTGRYNELIIAYNALIQLPDGKKFKWPKDINNTIEHIREKRRRGDY